MTAPAALPFEQIKKISEHWHEYWSARELYKVLEYTEYRKFIPVIEKAKVACKNSYQLVNDHFAHSGDMVLIGSGAGREINDYKLSRYACYLIVQNSDPSKRIVALGQSYFAIQTRKQEINQYYFDAQKRIYLRDEISHRNKTLAKTAKSVGVGNYAEFADYGYMGLYGWMRSKDIHTHKKLTPKQKILDHMDSEELAANLFRATQADAKLKRESVRGQYQANKTHFEVGKKVRKTIKELWGTMPEKLPTVTSIKETKKKLKKSCSGEMVLF